jgi:hypothetical protein
MADFLIALPITLKHEGGFVNDPTDPGGATNLGVTKRTWESWIKREATVEEIRNLQVSDVTPLYKSEYWDRLRLSEEVNQGTANSLFDFFVNVSPKTFHEVVSAAMPLSPDSLFREKVKHYVMETWRRRHSGLSPQEADKFLLNWIGRAADFV